MKEDRNVHLLSVIESERETKWKLEKFAQEQRNQLESLRKEVTPKRRKLTIYLDNLVGWK